MKIKLLFIFICLFVLWGGVNGQNPFYSCIVNFEDNPCWEGSYDSVEFPGTSNIWYIGAPHKTLFDSAHSIPNAIFTDSTGSYPVNNTSSFIIKFSKFHYCMCAPILGGFYKFDSDTLKDFGRIEISKDHGTTWLNALSDTVIPDGSWLSPKPILTGRIHQWTEFNAMVWDYQSVDTLYYRFSFISDSIQTNKEGWILDDIKLIEHTEGVQDIVFPDEITIYPNPAVKMICISRKTITGAFSVSIYDVLGQLYLQKTLNKNNEDIDISSLNKGIYMVRVSGRTTSCVKMIVKE